MTPDKALYYLENLPGAAAVPALYRDMPRPQLEALARECARPTGEQLAEAGLDRWARQPLSMPAWADRKPAPPARPAGTPQAGDRDATGGAQEIVEQTAEAVPAAGDADPVPAEPVSLVQRAVRRLERLSTPGRRRGAFLGHFARCRTIAEAAARAGIDRRTVHRWRKTIPKFDERCLEILETRRREAVENVILGAGQVEVRPVFYRGRRVGEVTRRDRTLDLYLVKQADAALARAEKRREAEADFEARVAAEVARRLAALSPPAAPAAEPSPAQQPAPAASVDSAAAPEDTPAILKTSPSAGHEVSPPAGETPCPANDLAAAPRTVPSGLSAPENVPDRGA